MKDLSTSGATIGRLYALSSVGSIVGTFLVGFYLMSWLGSRNIMFILSGLSLLLALLNQMNRDTGIALLIFVAAPFVQSFGKNNLLNIIDTEYCAVQVVTGPYPDAQSPVCKIMKVGNEYSSGMYLDSDSLAFVYSRFYKLMFHFHPNPQNTLLIGGGAYSVPKYFHQVHPEMHMDVLEIDPALTEIARKDFRLKTDERLVPIHEDGRIFLNKNKKQYDVIMGDAYRSLFNIPFHLVTQEAMEKMATSLKPDGILMVNILSPVTGPNRDLLQSMIRTCKAVFPEVKAFKPRVKESPDRVQNIMLVCAKQTPMYSGSKVSPEIQSMLAQEIDLKTVGFENGLVLRDDYAPVEHYAEKMLRSYFHQ
jgi:spermidine synthase